MKARLDARRFPETTGGGDIVPKPVVQSRYPEILPLVRPFAQSFSSSATARSGRSALRGSLARNTDPNR